MSDRRDEQVAVLANLVGRLAFLVEDVIGYEHRKEIEREADEIRSALAATKDGAE